MSYIGSKRHIENCRASQKAATAAARVKVECSTCGKLFSRGMLSRHQAVCPRPPCVVCGKPVKTKGRSTCSYSCSNTFFRSGENNPNWRESTYKTTCFAYHENKCVICDEVNIVEVHHLDEDSTNNEPSNLIPLCPTHHQYWHSRFKYLVEDKIRRYIANFIENDAR